MTTPQQPPPKITVSYRRTDSAMAGRIFDRLVQRFGKTSLFIDIDNIPFGGDFRKHIDEALKSSDLLIAVVGPKWVGSGESGTARIAQEADPVRVEIETALRRDITILPVLLEGAKMPEPSELPESIRDFAYRNAADVESGRDFDIHVDRLIKAIEQILGPKATPPGAPGTTSPPAALVSPAESGARRKPWLLLGGLAALLAVAGTGAALWFGPDQLPIGAAKDASTGTAYCDQLKRVVTEAKTNFVSILGPQTADTWTARIQLPGWDDCTVSDWTYEGKTTRYFGCSRASVQTLEELNARRDGADAYIQACLGADWIRRRRQFSDQTTDTLFEKDQDDAFIRIRESFYKDTKEYVLRLEIGAPQSAATSAPSIAPPSTD